MKAKTPKGQPALSKFVGEVCDGPFVDGTALVSPDFFQALRDDPERAAADLKRGMQNYKRRARRQEKK